MPAAQESNDEVLAPSDANLLCIRGTDFVCIRTRQADGVILTVEALGRDFLVRLIKSGVKPSISGDLWSESGMGLFGIFAHGITETWVMEKALICLVACEK